MRSMPTIFRRRGREPRACPLAYPLLAVLTLVGCQSSDAPGSSSTASAETVSEVAPRPLPLASPLNRPDIEISGLAWHGDTLVVLPQYPARAAGEDTRRVYGLSRSALHEAVTDSPAAPLAPIPVPLETQGISEHAAAYEGCEAIAFDGQRVYLLIEGKAEGRGMLGHLLRGRVAPGLQRIRVRGTEERRLPQQARRPNMSYESLVTRGDTVIAIFEANGAHINPTPRAHRSNPALQPLGSVSFPTLEYRATDATALDQEGRFWVLNYFYPGDRDILRPATDSLALRHGRGATHRAAAVERLVQYQYTDQGVRRTDRSPIWFELDEDAARNWEGVVRFGEGFLVATDRFPRTILAYVPTSPRERPNQWHRNALQGRRTMGTLRRLAALPVL